MYTSEKLFLSLEKSWFWMKRLNCGYFVSDLVKLAYTLLRYLVLQIYYYYYCHCILIVEELATCIQILSNLNM